MSNIQNETKDPPPVPDTVASRRLYLREKAKESFRWKRIISYRWSN
jgi:hypothetical protein